MSVATPERPNDRGTRESFSRARTWSIAFHVVLSSIALLAVVLMLNYLAHRHNHRFYLSNAASHKLTPLTLKILSELTNTVKVTVFYDRTETLFGSVSSLLKEYQTHSPKIDLEFVDYHMPGRAQAVRNQYKLAAEGESSRVIFDSAGQVRTVLNSELSDYGILPSKEVRRTGFRGEQLFTSALLNVTQSKPVNALFLQGHGEHRLTEEEQGYSRFATLLQNNNVFVRPSAPLLGSNNIPVECSLLVIAGPTKLFETEELEKIDQFLTNGGRLLLLCKGMNFAPTGLEQLLYKWYIQIGFDWVQDAANAQSNDRQVVVTSSFGSHPIVRSLLGSSLKLVWPRSVYQRAVTQNAADAPKVAELLFTGADGVQLAPNENNTWSILKKGSIPMAVAGERGAIQGVKTDKGSTRYVVIGDSLLLCNALFSHAANADFANLAINWLANRDTLLSEVGPSPVNEYEILLTEQQMSQIRWLFIAIVPGVVMLFGGFVWLRRRV